MYTSVPFPAIETALSPSRLTPYRTFFKARTDSEVVCAFQWNQTVAASLWPLVSLVELSLRNRVHSCFSTMYGASPSNDWYLGSKFPVTQSLTRKVDDVRIVKDSSGNLTYQQTDDVVASLSFGFWVEALRLTPQNQRWRAAKTIFPHYGPVADKSKWIAPQATWSPLLGRLERHKALRDRLAHHRPMWRWRFSPNPGDPLVLPTNPGAAMTALRQEAAQMERSLQDMDKALLLLWRGSLSQRLFSALTTSVGLHYSIHRPEEIAAQISPFRSPGYRGASQDLQSHGPARLI